MSRTIRSALCTAMLAAALPSTAAAGEPPKDVVDTAVAAGNFKTLVAAVQAADLVATLKGPGPYTVFAPT
ncbi:MAG TPA: fasciclin domain-containing protein, partial [Anaeromyxobacteraceae bacterium]|nr:fasciclin domain-containing protein [Anaeromyxobacteraceae bacterium]